VVMGPMPEEIEHFKNNIEVTKSYTFGETEIYEGYLNHKDLVLVRSGVGKVNTAMISQYVIDKYNPECIILTGVAGALNTNYEIGDIVIGVDYIQHDLHAIELGFKRGQVPYSSMHIFNADKQLLAILANYVAPEGRVHHGRILSGDQFLTQREVRDYGYLTNELNGDAVEMESGAAAQVCMLNEIRFLTLRVISDKADGNASVDFPKFLPLVAKRSYDVLNYLIPKI